MLNQPGLSNPLFIPPPHLGELNPGILFPWIQDAVKSAICVSLAGTVPPTAKMLHNLLNVSCLCSSWCQAVFYYTEPTALRQGFAGVVGGGAGRREPSHYEGRENSLKPWLQNSCWLLTEAHTSLPLTNVRPQGSLNPDQSLDNNTLWAERRKELGRDASSRKRKGKRDGRQISVWKRFTPRLCHIGKNREGFICNTVLE